MFKSWSDEAWEDFEYWTRQDRKTLKRILLLLKDIDRNGYEGVGKPERLSGKFSAYWSRRIDCLKVGRKKYASKSYICSAFSYIIFTSSLDIKRVRI
jgi:toxin YoeB